MSIDVGQPSVFVQIVEVLGNFRCNSLMRTKCQPFDITSSKYRALAQLSLESSPRTTWTCLTCTAATQMDETAVVYHSDAGRQSKMGGISRYTDLNLNSRSGHR